MAEKEFQFSKDKEDVSEKSFSTSLLLSYAFMYAKVYCVLGRDKKNYGLSFPLEIVKKEGEGTTNGNFRRT